MVPAAGVDDVVVRLHLAADQRLAQAERGVDDRLAAPPGQRIGGEEHARRLGLHHLLHDDGQRHVCSWAMSLRAR